MKQLSIGRASFSELIEEKCIYVDKTENLYNLISTGKYYFLSRPRRFGKSLTVSTLKEIFKGNKELFKDTFIYNTNYDWKKYPVIHFDFSKFDSCNNIEELEYTLLKSIKTHAALYDITLEEKSAQLRFDELIDKLAKKGKVVILIDEYDNPIISNITDTQKAKKIKDILKGFYKIIKSQDENVKFAFLTGVTKFSQVSVFSGLNNLTDLTMNGKYATLCGYTVEEIKNNFNDYIVKISSDSGKTEKEVLDDMKNWYNGFRFSKNELKVYNPWSALSFFNTGELENYWFETGTPSFLIELIKDKNFNIGDKNNLRASGTSFSTFDIENLEVKPLLFQTGYLTISDYDKKRDRFFLDFPNKEVKQSFVESLLKSASKSDAGSILDTLADALEDHDLEEFFESMDILFSKIDYDLHLKDEKYWQSLFYMILTLLGYKIHAEFKTIKGRIDAVVEIQTHIYIFEFKTSDSEEIALNQIKEREYYKRFKDSNKEIVLIGSRFVVEDKKLVNKYISEIL